MFFNTWIQIFVSLFMSPFYKVHIHAPRADKIRSVSSARRRARRVCGRHPRGQSASGWRVPSGRGCGARGRRGGGRRNRRASEPAPSASAGADTPCTQNPNTLPCHKSHQLLINQDRKPVCVWGGGGRKKSNGLKKYKNKCEAVSNLHSA